MTNIGPNDAAAVSVSDVLPAGLTFVSSPDCTAAGATVSCPIGTLKSRAIRSLTIVVRVESAAAGTTVTNSATVSSTTQDPDPTNNTSAAAVVIAPQADLSVTKRASSATVDLFQDVTYTLTVANAGPNDATGVTVTDSVPAGMFFVSADPACTFDAAASTVTCAIGTLANGARQDVTITLRPQPANAGQTLTNTARVTGDQPDPSTDDNASSASIFVPPQANLAIAKTVSPTTVAVGGTLTYTLAVTNAGPSTATSVTVDDPLPAGLTATSATAGQGTCTITGRDVRCALGDIPTNGQVEVTIKVTVGPDAGGTTLVTRRPSAVPSQTRAPTTTARRPPRRSRRCRRPSRPRRRRGQSARAQPGPGRRTRARRGNEAVPAQAREPRPRARRARRHLPAEPFATAPAVPRSRLRVCDPLPKGRPCARRRARASRGVPRVAVARLAGHHASRTFTLHALAGEVGGVTRIVNRGVATGSNAATVAGRARITVVPDAQRGPQFTG